MHSLDALRPARPAPSHIDFEELELCAETKDRLRAIHQRVGAPHGWRTDWIDHNWSVWQSMPHRFFALRTDDHDIGLVILNIHEHDVEIRMFALVPEYVGRGFGGAALTQAVELAWATGSPQRVWLHTASVDHPHALKNYQARGFTVYDVISKS